MEEKVLWQNIISQPSRQPKIMIDNKSRTLHSEGSTTSKTLDEIVANSSLKVDAPEFIPRSSENKIKISSSIQNRLKICRSNSETSDITEIIGDNGECTANWEKENDLKRLRQIINTLTKDPGQFDNLVQIFMDSVSPHLDDIILLSEVVHIIVNEAIVNANFRYTGAKLCWYVEQNCPSFRAELHLRCKKKLEENSNLQNILLFIAELYVQLPHMNIYGALLIDSFKKILAEIGADSIKCICQALKLTGYYLEMSNKNDLDEIMNQLDAVKNNVNGTTLALLNKILLLRQTNWGMTNTDQFDTEKHNESNEEQIDPNYEYDDSEENFYEEPFVHNTYLSDNTELTQEEEEFLSTNMISNEEFFSHPDSEDDSEMDEEIQEAYEEFLKTCKQ